MSRRDPYAEFQTAIGDPYADFQTPAKAKLSLSADLLAAKAAQAKKYPTQLEKQTTGGVEGAGPIETFSRNVASGFGIDPDSPIRGTLKNVVDSARAMKESYQRGAGGVHGIYAPVALGAGRLAIDMAKGFGRNAMEGGADIGEGLRSGDWTQVAKGAGHSTGFLASLLLARKAPEAVESGVNTAKGAAGTAAERLYESALKPGPRSNTLDEVRNMVRTGLDERIPVSEKGVRKLRSLKNELNAAIEHEISTNPNAPINPEKVASRVDPLVDRMRFQDRINDATSAQGNKNAFLKRHSTEIQYSPYDPAATEVPAVKTYQQPTSIPATRAQAIKKGIWQELKDSAFGELQPGYKESQKQIGRGLREELAAEFPNIQGMNAREGNLFGLEPELEAAVSRHANKNIFGIGTPIVGAATEAATGSLPAAAGAGALKELFGHPGVKSRLAIALSRLSK